MTSLLPGESSHYSTSGSLPSRNSHERQEEGPRWYFSRKEIEENSPSRKDGIDFKKETYLRKSYCTFLQDLGMKLKVPQVTIATAIIFSHRFFIRQSHAKNDRRTIATVCMFLAGKVEETPRPLKDVIMVSYEIIHKKDAAAAQRIKQKDVYEQQKELILLGEKVVLSTLGFDLNVHHPYKPLVEAIKKFKVAQNALAQVAWNFVNDGLRTSLCLQFKPHHIAAGAIFLAAKFLKVKLPSDGEKVWWQEFDVTPRQLEEVSNQMLELYEQNRMPPSQGSEVDSSAGAAHRAPSRNPASTDEQASRQTSSRPPREYSYSDSHGASSRPPQNQNNDNGSGGMGSVITDHKVGTETRDSQHLDELHPKDNVREMSNKTKPAMELTGLADEERNTTEQRDDMTSHKTSGMVGKKADISDVPIAQSPKEAIKLIRDKVKAKREKSRKHLGERAKKKDLMDEDDLIERELEDGLELAVEDERMKQKKNLNWSRIEEPDDDKEHGEIADGNHSGLRAQPYGRSEMENAEEGEMVEDASPVMLNSRKRKSGNSPDRQFEGRKRPDYGSSHMDREHKRHVQENHL